uniref:Uncharacterized protein n=1 Tax=Tanacetum cinerariifolium TaxID=118510 RepID=A0A699KD96_TANCI|nr:hypothetical protein [Tanacetum cinerariifolium]
MLVHQGEGSATQTEPHHTPSPEATLSHSTSSIPLPSIPTAPIPTVTQTDTTPIIQYSRRARIAQSSALPTVADEPASPGRGDSQGEACPTDSGFIADQDRATIANLQRQHLELLAKFQAQEVEINRLKERVKYLEDKEEVIGVQSGDDAPIKGRRSNEGEAAAERISTDSEEIARVLTSLDATNVLAGETNVPTGSGFIPTAGPPATIVSTASKVGPTARRRKGKEILVESDTPKKKKLQEQIDAQMARELEEQQEREDLRMNEQIARDAEVARIHAEEEIQAMIDKLEEQQEREDLRMNEQIARDAEVARIHAEEEIQAMIDSLDKSNETVAKYLQEYQQFASDLSLEKKIELISDLVKYQDHYKKVYKSYVWKRIEDFTPMGSKEEAERAKRQGIILEKEQVKKQKLSEEAPESKSHTEEVSEDRIKEMMQLVPVEDVYVQALQVKHPIIDWKVHSEGERTYWQIMRLGGSTACYQFFVDLLRQLDREDLNQLWALLYDLSGVHHVIAKDKEIFMLVEKDYPLRRGLALVMISYRLQVKNHSQMAEDLIKKIYNIANTPRKQSD